MITHAVNEIIGNIHTSQGSQKSVRFKHIALSDLDLIQPRASLQADWITYKDADVVAALKQMGDQPAPYIAGGSGNKHVL
jgi:hypothetical protein